MAASKWFLSLEEGATTSSNAPTCSAKTGFNAMMNGEGDVVHGWQNKLQSAIALITPSGMLAEKHRKMAEPGTANNR
jgi:uncharacterized protein